MLIKIVSMMVGASKFDGRHGEGSVCGDRHRQSNEEASLSDGEPRQSLGRQKRQLPK